MEYSIRERYIDLIKQTIAFTLWPEPPIDLGKYNYFINPIIRHVILLGSKIFSLAGLRICKTRNLSFQERYEGKIWPPGYGDTMIGIKRLDNIQHCIEKIIEDNIEGDFIETGVWRGGACIFMRAILAAYGIEDRKVYLADSFQGLPKPDEKTWPKDKEDQHFVYDFLAVSKKIVEENFRKYNLLDDQVIFIEGFFKDTLPNASVDKLSILRLDGDMYESTMVALECLYPKLSTGGFCIIDDFSLEGTRSAVEDYCKKHQLNEDIKKIDWTGIYWRKTLR